MISAWLILQACLRNQLLVGNIYHLLAPNKIDRCNLKFYRTFWVRKKTKYKILHQSVIQSYCKKRSNRTAVLRVLTKFHLILVLFCFLWYLSLLNGLLHNFFYSFSSIWFALIRFTNMSSHKCIDSLYISLDPHVGMSSTTLVTFIFLITYGTNNIVEPQTHKKF